MSPPALPEKGRPIVFTLLDRLERKIRRRQRKPRGPVLAVLAVLVALGTTYTFRNPWFRGNFGVVQEGQVYRSAQPVGDWPGLVARYKLATVLNLRGGSDADPWYAAEVAMTRQLGVAFYDLPLTATDRPSRQQLLTILDVLDRCKYPLLIHCKSGSDRTGLVSALYLMSQQGLTPEAAEAEFSVYYGHIPILGTRHLHEPLNEYADWLDYDKIPHTPQRFRDWVASTYRADDRLTPLVRLPTGPRDRRTTRATAHADSPSPR